MIYLDNNATTAIDPKVVDAMLPYLKEIYGNPSSAHSVGRQAKRGLEEARLQVAELIGCQAKEIVFTSCATESNNTIIKGVVAQKQAQGRHIITSQIEHPSVFCVYKHLEEQGCEVTFLPVDKSGRVNPEDLRQSIRDDTVLVSIMHGNNETGTVQPLPEMVEIAHQKNILFHTDASQSVGKMPVNVRDLGVDFLSLAGQKIYAPKGISAFYIRDGVDIQPLLHGGKHERALRAGTENMVFIVGLGKACQIAHETMETYIPRLMEMRDRLYQKIEEKIPDVVINGHLENRLCNTMNLSFPGVMGAQLLAYMPSVAASTGSACCRQGSHVLSAMNIPDEVKRGAIRLSVGKFNTMEEIEEAADIIISTVEKIKNS